MVSVTRWTEKTELFAEYPPLAVGDTSRFAIHLTRLDSFKALTEGWVEVHLRGGPAPAEVFRVDAPSRPGIFGVDVKPAQAGPREMVIVLQATGLDDEHRVGQVDVHANAEAARGQHPRRARRRPASAFSRNSSGAWTSELPWSVSNRCATRFVSPVASRPDRAAPPTWQLRSTAA